MSASSLGSQRPSGGSELCGSRAARRDAKIFVGSRRLWLPRWGHFSLDSPQFWPSTSPPSPISGTGEGETSRTRIKIEAFAHCEWEQMTLRSSLARNAEKKNAPFWILKAKPQHSFWLYFHAVDTCNHCETFEIISWAVTLIGSPGSVGVRHSGVALVQDVTEVSVYGLSTLVRCPEDGRKSLPVSTLPVIQEAERNIEKWKDRSREAIFQSGGGLQINKSSSHFPSWDAKKAGHVSQ